MDRRLFVAGVAFAPLAAGPAYAQAASAWRHPELDQALSLIQSARWRELSSLVSGLPPQRARVLLADLGDEVPLGVALENALAHPMGNTIAAAVRVGWAWRYRGHGVASTITQEGLAGFVDNLNRAKVHIEQAVQSDPDDGVARAIGFTVYMGLSDLRGLSDSLPGYLLAARRPVTGFAAFGNAISRKWLGSEEVSLTFARQACMLDLPASAGLIPDLHFIAWQSRAMANAAAAGDFAAYLAQPTVRAEIVAANESYNSVGPDPDQFANWYANAWFSFTLMMVNEPDLARPHFQNMGDYLGGPWSDLPDARRTIQSIRHHLGLETL